MKTRKSWLSWLLTVTLLLGVLLPLPASAANLYFTSVNDTVLPLTRDTMPLWSGGVLYVPYSVFDSGTTGVDLDVECSYSRSGGTLSFYRMRQVLLFDLNEGTCRNDITGEAYSARAILRNGRPYVSLGKVCDFFGLSYTYNQLTDMDQAYLVRIKSDAVVLSDAKFIDAAGDLINRRLRDYNQSQTPSGGDGTGSNSKPAQSDESEDGSAEVQTYLAFRCQAGDDLTALLTVLTSTGHYGLFLFSPEDMEGRGDLLRQLVGQGHTVGILAQGEDVRETRRLLSAGQRTLERETLTRTTVACVPENQRGTLEAAGWVCWRETLSLDPAGVGASTFAARTTRRLAGRTRSTYLTLPGGADTARVLPVLLRQLEHKHFSVGIPLETRL